MSGFYRFGKVVTGLWLKFCGLRIFGKENVPVSGPLVVIANHVSFGDIPVIAQAFPYPLTFIAKEAFSQNAFTKKMFSAGGAVFLKKDESDMTAMRQVMGELKKGHSICIFPEGTRHLDQNMGEFKPGAAFLAYRGNAKVLPVSLLNTGDCWRFWKRNILVRVGKPIELDHAEKLSQEYLDRYNHVFHDSVAGLLEENKALIAAEGRQLRVVSKKKRA